MKSKAAAPVLVGVGALVVLGVCVWLGVVKFDEGWYAVSSRLAARGSVPYRDFAFPQGPLFLYVLAPFQALAPGIVGARVVSTVCAAGGIVLIVSTARRLAGGRAALVTGALLLCMFPALPYWLAVTKTYGLASLLLAATVATLTSNFRPSVRLPLATATAGGFALTRTSGATLAVLVFGYCLFVATDRRTRVYVTLVAAVLVIPFLALVGVSGDRAAWNLFSYHQATTYWSNPHPSRATDRLSELFVAWPAATFLTLLVVGALVIARDPSVRRRVRAHADLVIVAVGIAAFILTHMLSGAFFAEEYTSPLIPTLVLLGVVTACKLHESLPFGENAAFGIAVALAVLFTPHHGYLGAPGWAGAPSSLSSLTRCIDLHSQPGDRVFALALLEAVPAAHREAVPGVTIGPFSYEDVSTARAEHLHILNSTLVLRTIANPSTSVVVLSDVDRQLLSFRGWFSQRRVDTTPIERELQASYRPVCAVDLVRELQDQHLHATVYARTPSPHPG